MPVTPNALERLLLYRLHRAPGPIVDLFGTGAFKAAAMAIEAGLFDALDEPKTVDVLASETGTDPGILGPLLASLAAQNYVTRSGDTYERTAMTESWLTDDGRANMAPWFTFWDRVVLPYWNEHQESVLTNGEPPLSVYEWLDEHPEKWPITQRGFRAAASVVSEDVADSVDVPAGAERLIDVGGGHGEYAMAVCRRHPSLSAVVFDDPAALDVAREAASDAGLSDRVRTRGGDYLQDDLGDGYDVALVFNVLHGHDDAEVRRLVDRTYDALNPGGRIAILDQYEGTGWTAFTRVGVTFVGLAYQVLLGTTVHDVEDVTHWLRATGFEGVETTAFRRAGPGNSLVQATRPG